MDELKVYRNILVVADNINRMIIHREYAVQQLKYLLEELDDLKEVKMWSKYLNILQELEPVFKELDNNVEIEKEKQKYKDKLFQDD